MQHCSIFLCALLKSLNSGCVFDIRNVTEQLVQWEKMVCIRTHILVHLLAILDLTLTLNIKLIIRICEKRERRTKILFFCSPKNITRVSFIPRKLAHTLHCERRKMIEKWLEWTLFFIRRLLGSRRCSLCLSFFVFLCTNRFKRNSWILTSSYWVRLSMTTSPRVLSK